MDAYCDNCQGRKEFHLDYEKDVESSEPYTDLVCNECYSIMCTISGHVIIKDYK